MEYKEGISVIIPVYNAGQYIERCLNSLLRQTYSNLEIICVLDKSSVDNSEQILNTYSKLDNRIKIIKAEDGQGQGYNRNLGIEYVTREYMGFIDADDYVDLDFYEQLLDTAKIFNSDVVVSDIIIFNESTQNVVRTHEHSLAVEYLLSKKIELIKEGVCWDKLYKSNLIKDDKDIRFPEGVLHEDNMFVLKVLNKCNKLTTSPGACYHWIRNQNSVCFKQELAEKRMDDSNIVIHQILDLLATFETSHRENIPIIDFFMKKFGWMAYTYPKYKPAINDKIIELTK